MPNQPDDIRQWIQELISRSAADQMQNMRRFEELLRRSLRGEIDQGKLREEYLGFARQESTRYINDLTRVGLGFYNTLLEMNRQYNDRFFEKFLKDQRTNGAATKSEPAQVPLELHGPLGKEASRAFVIENQRTEPVAVSFLVSEFSNVDETSGFRPPLQLSPARFTLKPGEERLVSIKIPLLEELFVPGVEYHAVVLVSGFEGMQIQLKTWADLPQTAVIEGQPTGRRQQVFYPVEEAPIPEATIRDDLKRIKGIGPAIETKLHSGGVQTFKGLAGCDPTVIERLLGPNMAKRSLGEHWLEQARLAAAGDWAALAALQERLK